METNSKNISLNVFLIVIAVGIWGIFLQNSGIIPTKQNVYVKGGYINADVNNTIDVTGYLDVNLEAINGKSNAFYDFGGNKNFVRIPVYTGY